MAGRHLLAMLCCLLAGGVAAQQCIRPDSEAKACGSSLVQRKSHVSPAISAAAELGCECWCIPATPEWSTKCSWSSCSGCPKCAGELHVPTQVPTPPHEPTDLDARTRAADARFLLQATFGPTRVELERLSGKNFSEWLLEQMEIEIGSHRAYFRERVNPHSSAVVIGSNRFHDRPMCSRGSRWHRHALSTADVGKVLKLTNDLDLLIEGQLRTNLGSALTKNGLSPSDQCTDAAPRFFTNKGVTCASMVGSMSRNCKYSGAWVDNKYCEQTCYDAGVPYDGVNCFRGWSSVAGLSGVVCQVEEFVGGFVTLGANQACSSQVSRVPNPAIWLSDPSRATRTSLSFEENQIMPGVIFLAERTQACDLGGSSFIQHQDKFYLHDARIELNDNTCQLPAGSSYNGFFAACGSPGEVSNEPDKGHQLPARLVHINDGDEDTWLDNRYGGGHRRRRMATLTTSRTKATIWLAKALAGQDQLRQRMAWALSQIFVVSSAGTSHDPWSEMWLTFYDIFVRHAFGNFKDVLREVTYSPVMGEYLTFMNSRSYDTSGTHPDENYAREIMQLFTIGVAKLAQDGHVRVDHNGAELPTYSNENIMDFARVFTGFYRAPGRANIELRNNFNYIDPMKLNAEHHDVFPKPDLEGGYLGDGHPLCHSVPQRAFLLAGARFEFRGKGVDGIALELESSSQLRVVLCGGVAPDCTFAVARTLEVPLACYGAECELETARLFKVGDGFYEYVPPPCVHPFFFNGRRIADGQRFDRTQCAQPYGKSASASCCNTGCKNAATSWMRRNGHTCENHNKTWTKRDGTPKMTTNYCRYNKKWAVKNRKYCQLACWEGGAGYQNDDCSAGSYSEHRDCTRLTTFDDAASYCGSLGMGICPEDTAQCSRSDSRSWTLEGCSISVRVHDSGDVSAHTETHEPNSFRVNWCEGSSAPAGDYDAEVLETPVFEEVPTKPEAIAALKIGVFSVPDGFQCIAPCTGDVKAWGNAIALDANTIFEVDGRFYKNIQSIVHIGSKSFRNPPVFIAAGPLRPQGRDLEFAVIAEVESLLEHLVRHSNTPIFVSKKLIQRFVTSNPSPAYITAVATAFTTGEHQGINYSGMYGDLAATLAAILLHPEARSSDSNTTGLLREPMLKLVHFMRSMEYTDASNQLALLKSLEDKIGQFPYRSPTVFNFFDAMYQPPRFTTRMTAPEPESEPESEAEAEPEQLVGPEFQIFTPPLVMGFLNGMSSLLEHGVSTCDSGFGAHGWGKECRQGGLAFEPEGATVEKKVGDLDVLLTGGRLASASLGVVKSTYEDRGLSGAQQAIVLTPEFQTLGTPKPGSARSVETQPEVSTPSGSYKALVMLFLAGGADTYNMLVPIACGLYDEYKAVRTNMALTQQDLLPITTPGQTCRRFGVHPALPFVAHLYSTSRAAFISNIGALVEPMTRETWTSGGAERCLGIFSHSHQQTAAQTLQCQVPGAAPRGVGGRIADTLASVHGKKVSSFSVSGMAAWSGGFNTSTEIIHQSGGAIRFNKYQIWGSTIDQLAKQRYGNVFCEEYTRAFAEHIRSSETLGDVLAQVALETADYRVDTSLAQQLHQVARLIKGRDLRSAERDFFFVQMGGFDTHGDQTARLSQNFEQINNALEDFVAELEAQNVFDKVVLVTHSDFGRTLTSNGAGTDHGWGGNHLVIGGRVRGGRVFNDFLSSYYAQSDYDAGRGRVIPKYPWESVMVPIAEWMGILEPGKVFPNLGNFNSTSHIINQIDLFRV